ncbi:MAG: HNH endonuclease [Waterburya sp.]
MIKTLQQFSPSGRLTKHQFQYRQNIPLSSGLNSNALYLGEAGYNPTRQIVVEWACGHTSAVLLSSLMNGNTSSYGGLISQPNLGEIKLTCGAVALVDAAYWWTAKCFNWSLSSHGYAIRHTTKLEGYKKVLMHRDIMGFPDCLVDHINGNKLDNRTQNLRLATKSENNQNRRKMPNNTSGNTGVSWNKKKEKWVTYITKENKRYYLGSYACLFEAFVVRERAMLKEFGDFSATRLINCS